MSPDTLVNNALHQQYEIYADLVNMSGKHLSYVNEVQNIMRSLNTFSLLVGMKSKTLTGNSVLKLEKTLVK